MSTTMLKMFLCESHIIFLSKLREHHVANAVYKVTSDCEVKLLFPLLVLFSMPSCSRSKHCSTMSLLLVFQVSWMRDIWLSLARNKRVSSEIIKTIKIFFFLIHKTFCLKYSKMVCMHQAALRVTVAAYLEELHR